MNYQRKIAVYCCVICTAFFLSAPAWAVYLSFTPSDSTIQPGNSVSVDIFVSGLETDNLAAFDFDVNFNPEILTFDSYVLGNGLGSIDIGDAENFGLGSLSSGVINIAVFSNFRTIDAQPETFRLATLTFTGIHDGSSSLLFSDAVFGNEENISMSGDVNASSLIRVETQANNIVEIYRSVEPGRTESVAQSAGVNPLVISGDIAQFSNGLPANIGVGDVLVYGEQNHAAFIHKRISPAVFTVRTNTGAAPVPISADNSWSIYRAYTSLRDAENGNENTGIPQQLRNFDTWTGGKDLIADNQRWIIACYAGNPDTSNIYINGWTTGPENYIRIFTPHTPDQVGISQRHDGKWSETSYRLVTTAADDYQSSICIREDYVRIEGLQIHTKANNFSTYGITTNSLSSESSNHIYVSDCILKGDGTPRGGGIRGYDFMGNLTVRNTIVYDMGDVCISASGQHTFEAYNNTVYNCWRGFHVSNPAFIVKNNISAESADYDYANWFGSTSSDNVSSDGSAAMWGLLNGITYIVPEEHFIDVEARDFHLKNTSSLRGRNAGAFPE